jgi:chromosomal replication initiator protein
VDGVVDRRDVGEAEAQVTDAERLWKACAEALQDQVSESTWKTFFQGIRPVSATSDRLVLAVPNPLVKERLEGRYLALVQDAVAGIAGGGVAVVLEVHTNPDDDDEDEDDEPLTSTDALATGAGGRVGGSGMTPLKPPPDARTVQLPINPKYTFDTFVIGASNRFAHAAALSVAETPAKSYNPLFIHGEAGLGKTHLLHAIGHYVREHYLAKTIRYVSTETFMNEFIDAIRTNTTSAFKRRYRECDVLLVDDIQFLENKEGTQEEFFHTFNTIYGAGGQIVITSDRHAKSLATLEERLRSRFLSGLITDVQPPDLETRLAILRKKAEVESAHLPDEVLEFIAIHIKNNIRELEGALVRVSAFASLNREPPTRALAERVLADSVSADEPRPITPKLILDTTSETFGFSVEELCGPNRRRPLVMARQIGMYVFRELTDFSYPAIAREFGGRDHTTVIHAVEKISGQMKERRQIYDQVTELMHRIRKGA